MDKEKVAQSRKAEAARRQLGTALHLWLEDLDPVSVHVLASGGCEVAEALVKQVGTPHSKFVLEAHSDITEKQLWAIRNALWNAMKHANKRDGTPRDDEELLSKPLEEENEARLYEGWFNLMQIMPIPVEAHFLTLWFLAKRVTLDKFGSIRERVFPHLQSLGAVEQKALLNEQIKAGRNNAKLERISFSLVHIRKSGSNWRIRRAEIVR